MKYKLIITLLFSAFIVLPQTKSGYCPHMVFDPSFNLQPGTRYRSGSGAPGQAYWQNKADYKISAKLDDKKIQLTNKNIVYFVKFLLILKMNGILK
jgi:hypothetical protein